MEYMSIGYIIASIFLGVIPEVLYLTLFLTEIKDIKTKRIRLFLLIGISHLVLILFNNYQLISYVIFICLLYAILKLLYKKQIQIIDVFIINISLIYLTLIGFICSRFVNNNYTVYFIMLIVNRILLFIPLIFKKKLRNLYKIYYSLWNRNYDKKQPIKSITLRNVSLIVLNIFVFIMNIISVSMTNFMK